MARAEKEIDDILAEATANTLGTSPTQWLLYLIMAFIMNALPIYLYTSPLFDLSLEENHIQFYALLAFGTLALIRAYHTVANKTRENLLEHREVPRDKKSKDVRKELENTTTIEATAYSLFVINSIFLLSFLSLAFVFLPRSFQVGHQNNSILSLVIPALVLGAKPALLV